MGKKVLVLLGFLVLIIGCVSQVGNNDIPVVSVEESELILEELPEQEETFYVNEILEEGKIYVYLNDSLFEAEINETEKTIYVSNKSIGTSKEPKNNFQQINLPSNTQLQNLVFTIQNNTLTTLSQSQQQNYTVKKLYPQRQTRFSENNITHTYMNETEFYEGRERSYDTGVRGGKWEITTPLKGQALNDYFKSLNLQEDPVYVLMQFETWPEGDPTQEQIDKMKQAGLIKLYQYHGDHTYPAKVTKNFLENHNFDHVRWIGIVENKDPYLKIVQDYKDHFLSQNAVNIEIVLHGGENSEIAIITNLSNRVINIRGNNLIVNMNSSKLFKVLSFNFVRNVNPYSEPQKESLGEK